MADKWIEVTDKAERVNHWMLAISCILLFITGMGMMYKELNFLSFLGLGLVSLKTLHNYLGIVFIIALVRSTAMWWLEAGHFDMPEDWEWIKCAGGYLWHVDKVPETGKYNPGQKLFFLTVVAYGALMGATGLIMWIQPSLLHGASPLDVPGSCVGICGPVCLLLCSPVSGNNRQSRHTFCHDQWHVHEGLGKEAAPRVAQGNGRSRSI
jgi:cytochrome b subunit of formate dehydrogenase